MQSHHKEFGISTWAINNRTTVYVITFIFIALGIYAYITMPRENFPEVRENKIYIASVNPGNSAEDIEKLITKPLEEQFDKIKGVSKIKSSSFQDYSTIIVEFEDDVKIDEAKQKVKDKVDEEKAKQDWPVDNRGAKVEPNVFDLNISEELPILNVTLRGDYQQQELKKYGEILQDEIEKIEEIKQVDIRGVNDKEVEIAVDVYKMAASQVSFDDIARAVQGENVTISGGNLITNGGKSSIRVDAEITNPDMLNYVVVKSLNGEVALRDIANIAFKEKEKTTYAREMGENVISLDVKKRSGQNMISAIEQTKEIIKKAQVKDIPKDISIKLANDMSTKTEHQVDELSNHILFGIILVMFVLMFTMGLRNSFFVGTAIPLSMLMAFAFLQLAGNTLNTMVLFALVMGLGMLVDDGIVVVDNVYANLEKGFDKIHASRFGIGEIAWPVISSTATTLAAFFPLGLWPGTMGKFMIYFPLTLSVVLGASLFVAMIINASMTAGFIKLKDENISDKTFKKTSIILLIVGILFLIPGFLADIKFLRAFGNLALIIIGLMWIYKKYLFNGTQKFQYKFFPRFEKWYQDQLQKILVARRPLWILVGMIVFLFFTFIIFGIFIPKVEFFPANTPNQVFVYVEYPQGTDIKTTNATVEKIENQVIKILDNYKDEETKENFLVQAIVSQVGEGAQNPDLDAGFQGEMPYKGKITVSFVEYNLRRGIDTNKILDEISQKVRDIPGAKISVEKERSGPPSGFPISIQIAGDDYDKMLVEANKMIDYLNKQKISGIEQLATDVNKEKPEMLVNVDREKAGYLNASSYLVGITLRRSLYGQEISTYKEGDDDYNITMRAQQDQRENESVLLNQPMTFRNMATGQLLQIPISAVATVQPSKSFDKIKRENNKRAITIYSNVLPGYNANEIIGELKTRLTNYTLPEGISYKFTGEQEEQAKNMAFLQKALLIAIAAVLSIIVLQFNSISKSIIIMTTVLFSFSGVFLGLTIFRMNFVIIMTMMGIISLIGVVVKNGIVLMDFFVLLLDRKIKEKNVDTHDDLSIEEVKEVIIESGRSRLRPVLLTATTAVLGLIPLAIGLNFNFITFLTDYNPHLYLGGDNVIFWAPLAWTIIFGLTFATFLTLVMVPVMFYLVSIWKIKRRKKLLLR